MANTHTTLTSLFTEVANAIREKTNSTMPIVADNFPTEIENLRTGFDYNNQNVTTIPDHAFYGCEDLNSVDCYNVTSIGASAFENCTNLKSVILWDSVTSVGENAFDNCDNVIIYYKGDSIPETWHENFNPDNRPVLCGELVDSWDISATEDDNVVAELYGNSDNYILYIRGNGNMKGFNNFSNTQPWNMSNIKSAIIQHGVTSIGTGAFQENMSLTSIIIPASITNMGENSFSSCDRLTSVYITNLDFWCNINFKNADSNPLNNVNASLYLNNKLVTSITIPDSVTSIGNYTFSGCRNLTSITIPDSVTSIGRSAFSNCHNLTSITIPDSVTSINYYTFNYCRNLTSITIPDSVTSIYEYAFNRCSNLTSIIYTGTTAQWKSIKLYQYWNYDTPDYTIHCTDGDIAKDGTITYHETT